ncbi:MAG: hypothetical protein ACRDIV_22075 [Ktedonobacteraceae bacterium]
MIIETGKTYIRKLRAISVGASAKVIQRDPLALQLRLSSVLSVADLQPRGVPASSIICIRSLHAPHLPAQYTRYGGERPPLWWEERVRDLIKRAIQQAAYPLEGAVPVDAEAVIFADRAELLACLASDWRAGNGSDHWWWQSLFRTENTDQLLLPAWLEMPEYIPAALHYLAAQHRAVPFVRRLPSHDVRTLLQSIAHNFALHELQTILTGAFQSQRTERPSRQEATEQPFNIAASERQSTQHAGSSAFSLAEEILQLPVGAASPLEESRQTPIAPQASYGTVRDDPHRKQSFLPPEMPWRPWVPESMEQGLSLEQQALLGIGLMLMRTPSIVRTTSFARAVYRWCGKINLEAVGAGAVQTDRGNPHGSSRPAYMPKGDILDVQGMERGQTQDASENGGEGVDESGKVIASIQSVPVDDSDGRVTGQPLETLLVNEGECGNPPVYSQIPETPSFPPSLQEHSQGNTPTINEASVYDRDTPDGYHEGDDRNEGAGGEARALHSSEASTSDEPGTHMRDQFTLAEDVSQKGQEPERPQEPPLPILTVATPADGGVEAGKGFQDGGIKTAFGGIFYLINLGLFLDLYGDFTTPLQPGLALSMWDFVALLGQQMLGQSLQADPVWSLLASLSGRQEEEAPGYAFEPLEQWRVPVTWLRAFPAQDNEGSWLWYVEDGRLRVLHPAQFLLLDVPLETLDPLQQLKREMQGYSDLQGQGTPQLSKGRAPLFPDDRLLPCGRLAVNSFAGDVSPLLLRWLRWLMPYIYARLQRALGLAETEDPSRVLCLHSASISVTMTHVDILLALKDLPVEIRMAGLDRNPGWVPAAGRFIAFHFQ